MGPRCFSNDDTLFLRQWQPLKDIVEKQAQKDHEDDKDEQQQQQEAGIDLTPQMHSHALKAAFIIHFIYTTIV